MKITKKYTLRKIGKFLLPVAFGVIVANTTYSTDAFASDNNSVDISSVTKDDLIANIDKLKNEIATLELQKQSLEAQIQNILTNNDGVTDNNIIQNLQSQIADLEVEVANKEELLKTLTVDNIDKELNKITAEKDTLAISKANTKADIDTMNSNIDNKKTTVNANNEKISTKTFEIEEIERKNQEARERVSNINDEINNIIANNNSINNNIDSLNNTKSHKLDELSTTNNNIDNINNDIISINNDINSKSTDLDNAKALIDNNSINFPKNIINDMISFYNINRRELTSEYERNVEYKRKRFDIINKLINVVNNDYIPVPKETQDSTKYDITNLPKDLQVELSYFTANIINEIRTNNNKSAMSVTKDSIAYANKIANAYSNASKGKNNFSVDKSFSLMYNEIREISNEYHLKNDGRHFKINKLDSTSVLSQSNVSSKMMTKSEIKEKIFHDLLTAFFRVPGQNFNEFADLLGNRGYDRFGNLMLLEENVYFAISFSENTLDESRDGVRYINNEYGRDYGYDGIVDKEEITRRSKGSVTIRTHFIKIDSSQFTERTVFDTTPIAYKSPKERVAEIEREVADLESSKQEKEREQSELRARANRISSEIENIETEIALQRERIEDTREKEAEKQGKEQEIREREEEKRVKEVEKERIEEENKRIVAEVKEIEQAKKEAEKEIERITERERELEDKERKLQEEKQEIINRQEQTKEAIESIRKEIERIKALLSKLRIAKESLVDNNRRLSEVEAILRDKKALLTIYENELAERNRRKTAKPDFNLVNDDKSVVDINEIKDKTPFTSGAKNLVNEDKPVVDINEIKNKTAFTSGNKNLVNDDKPIVDINEIKNKTPFTSGVKILENADKPTITAEEIKALEKKQDSKEHIVNTNIKNQNVNNKLEINIRNNNTIKKLPATGVNTIGIEYILITLMSATIISKRKFN